MKRRDFLKNVGGSFIVWQTATSSSRILSNEKAAKKNIIWVVLRGAMDALHAVVPHSDSHLIQHRSSLVSPIQKNLLRLNNDFSLHPKLEFLHVLYSKKQFSPVVAVASPYRQRSHFDAQDILESGKTVIDSNNGWLARALEEHKGEGLAIARSVPVSMRGSQNTRTWYPSNLPEANDDLYERLKNLYQHDTELGKALQESIDTNNMVGDLKSKRRPKFPELATSCARLLKNQSGPDCAMLEMGGWDTHTALVRRLDRQFNELDNGIKALHDELGPTWNDTLVIIASEFGRTVRVNGTLGSDHGTGSALLLCGGGIDKNSGGGSVQGIWPGLAPDKLFENRDLRATSDTFSWLGAALKKHWHLSDTQIQRIFPDSPLVTLG